MMKRALPPVSRALLPYVLIPALALGLAPALPGECPGQPGAGILPWIARVRDSAGVGRLEADPVLERAARDYANALARRGVLAHRDGEGRDARDRLQAAGGTSSLVGEILGSGPGEAQVTAAWMSSAAHREVVENPLWSHFGAGCAAIGSRQVWVVVFAAERLRALRIESSARPQGYRVSGRLPGGDGLQPVLVSGLDLLEPELWRPSTGEFLYAISPGAGQLYHRLGFRDAEGRVTITDVFYPARAATSSPEMERR